MSAATLSIIGQFKGLDWIKVNSENDPVAQKLEKIKSKSKKELYRSAGSYFILKELNAGDEKTAASMLQFQQRLKTAGLPVPELVLTHSGLPYVIGANSLTQKRITLFYLQRFVEGWTWQGKKKECESLATVLATLHSLSQGMTEDLPLSRKSSFERCLDLLSASVTELPERYADFRSNDKLLLWKEFTQWAQQRLAMLWAQARSKGYGSEAIAIHGDYHPLNALFTEKGDIAALLDFDECRYEDKLDDFLRAVLHIGFFDFCGELPKPAHLEGKANLENLTAFARTYHSSSKELSPLHRKYLFEMLEAIAVEIITIYFLRGLQKQIQVEEIKGLLKKIESTLRNALAELSEQPIIKTEHVHGLRHQPEDSHQK